MFCANCGSKLPEGAKFCGGCGAKTEPVQPDYTASVEPAPMRPNQSPSVYPPPTQTVKNMPRDDAKAIVKDLVENGKTKNSMPWAENLFTPESINLTNNIYSIFDTLVDTMSSFTELTSMQMRFTADKVSKGVSVAGLGISLTQLGIDLYYSNGNDRTAAVNLYKNVFTSSGTLFTYMTGYGSLPFSAAFLGAAVLAFGLDYGVQTAEEYKDTVNKAIFDQYYRDYAKFDEQYWYKLFAGTYIDAWQNGKASAEGAEVAYKTVLDAMEENTQKFWADVFREGSDALTFAVGGADKTNYYTPKEEQKAEYIEAYRKYMNMRFRKKVVPWIEQYLLIQQQNALYKSLWKLCEPFNEFYSVQIQEIAPYDSGDPCKYQEHTIRFGNESGFTLIDIPDTWTLHAPQDDDQWAVCFCCCLLSVRTETGKQKKIASRKPGTKSAIHGGPHTIEARSDMGMFCPNCGNRMTEGAVFCTNCGAKIQAGTSNICSACGSELPEGTAFCIGCGKAVSQAVPEPMATRQAAASTPPQGGTGLVGFSDRCYSQEILAAAQKNMRIGIRFMFVLAILPLIGFPVAGLLIDEMPLGEAVIIGAVLSFIMLVINLLTLQGSKQPMWEGVVVNKYSKIEYKHRGEDSESYTAFYTVIHTDAGKKKIINEGESRRHMYDYLSVGDRVRYHPSFGTYEKYDKSGDRIIYCNVCTTMSPIQNDRCKKCNNLLFK